MCCAKNCCLTALYTTLSAVSLGLFFIICLVVFILIEKNGLDDISDEYRKGALACLIIAAVMLVLSIFVSCCGCCCCMSYFLGFLYLMMCAFLIIVACIIWGTKPWLKEQCAQTWTDITKKDLKDKIEKWLDCTGYSDMGHTCKQEINKFLDKWDDIIAGIFLGLAVLNLVGCILSCCVCKPGHSSKKDDELQA